MGGLSDGAWHGCTESSVGVGAGYGARFAIDLKYILWILYFTVNDHAQGYGIVFSIFKILHAEKPVYYHYLPVGAQWYFDTAA